MESGEVRLGIIPLGMIFPVSGKIMRPSKIRRNYPHWVRGIQSTYKPVSVGETRAASTLISIHCQGRPESVCSDGVWNSNSPVCVDLDPIAVKREFTSICILQQFSLEPQ